MTSWFRSWHGAPTDNKWLVIARRANVAPGVVSAVAWALMDHASQAAERGSVAGFDVETYCAFSGFPESDVAAILDALLDKGVVGMDSRLTAWDKRQPKREDDSSGRVRNWRAEHAKSVTPPLPDDVTHGNAKKRSVTHGNNTEQNRTDTEAEVEVERKHAQTATTTTFEAFMQARGGAVNAMDGEQLGELEALYGADATIQAIGYCNSHRKQPFLAIGYIARTLAGWQQDGPPSNGNAPPEEFNSARYRSMRWRSCDDEQPFPPASDAEAAVLGSLILDSNGMDEIPTLQAGDFYAERNGRIFQVISRPARGWQRCRLCDAGR